MQDVTNQQIRILHVDNNPSIIDLTETFLKRENDCFVIETATSADEGLKKINDCPPDCVVSDYNIPGMDGIEFLRAVRQDQPNLPFILFTGKGSEAVASEAISADVTDYLQKRTGSEQYELLANRIHNAVQARREATRAERQEQLMRLTEFAGDTGGFEIDTETGEVLMTDGAYQLSGLPARTSLSFDEAVEFYHPEDRADIQHAIDRACQTDKQTEGIYRYQHPDGEQRLWHVTFTQTSDGNTSTVRGAVHDITEERQIQEQLESERRLLNQSLNALADIFYMLNADGTFRRWNDQVPQTTGYTDSELADMQAIELFAEDDHETIADAVQMVISGETVTVEADLLTTDGDRIPYEFTGAPLTDGNANTTSLVGIGRDLSC
jgi:PAS domain S-box-containing protein